MARNHLTLAEIRPFIIPLGEKTSGAASASRREGFQLSSVAIISRLIELAHCAKLERAKDDLHHHHHHHHGCRCRAFVCWSCLCVLLIAGRAHRLPPVEPVKAAFATTKSRAKRYRQVEDNTAAAAATADADASAYVARRHSRPKPCNTIAFNRSRRHDNELTTNKKIIKRAKRPKPHKMTGSRRRRAA